jgi:hypothetical protein
MPSFDIVNKLNYESFKNAVDAVNREVSTRYDFKGSDSEIQLKDKEYTILADSELKLNQIKEILSKNLVRKSVDVKNIDFEKQEKASGNMIRQKIKIIEGIEKEISQIIIKHIKEKKNKVQTSIQGDQIRVQGKKRDELQDIISSLKNVELKIPINFINFRD